MSRKVQMEKTSMTKKSALPYFDGEIYNKYLASTYDFLTTLTGWRSKIGRYAMDGLVPCKMLDVGCGTGFLLKMALERGFDAQGVDPSEVMLKLAVRETNIPENRLHCAKAQKLPFADGTFDLITASGSLMYEPDMPSAAHELARILKKGGRLRVIDHTAPRKKNLMTPIIYLFMHVSGWLIHDFEYYFSPCFELADHRTLGRGGYLQRFDFLKR